MKWGCLSSGIFLHVLGSTGLPAQCSDCQQVLSPGPRHSDSPKARGGCDGEEEAGVCIAGGNVSKRKGPGGCGIRGSQRLEPSSHTEDRRDFDHTTIYSPDGLSLPPLASVTKMRARTPACMSTYMPHSPRTQGRDRN